jgi:hypothetical protein
VDHDSYAAERAVSQFIGLDPEVTIRDVDEPSENVDEKTMTSTQFIGLARL